MRGNKNFYKENSKYSRFLERQDYLKYLKYVDKIFEYSGDSFKILDVGCGVGQVIEHITKRNSTLSVQGIDISNPSIRICKTKGLDCKIYDGTIFPYKKEEFDIVGAFTVLEHVNDPIVFLDECYRITKKTGYLFIVAPNFFSITNNYHCYNNGILNKMKIIILLITKLFSVTPNFIKLPRPEIKMVTPDIDASWATNPIEVINWASQYNMKLLYWSSQHKYNNNFLKNLLDNPITRIFMGSFFLIFKKSE